MTHLEQLMKGLDGICDCAIINDTVNRRYFTGMKSSDGYLVVFKDAAYLIIDFRYIEKARQTAKGCEVILQDKKYSQINELIIKHNASVAAVDTQTCTVDQFSAFKNALKADVTDSNALSKLIRDIRCVKSQDEIDNMISAQRIAEKGLEHILDIVRPGMTEREVRLELDNYMLRNGAEELSFDTIALSGSNTSLPHGVPSDKKIQAGEFVLLDFGAVVNGYHSDMTRTFCIGEPSEKMRRVYDIVLKAQLAALDAVKAGMTGKALDAVARDIIASEGFGKNFGHSLGHGVGMEIHEMPYASPNTDDILPENSVVTVEPGIYLEGEFGVRIEDFVVVKKDGCENMTKAEKKLIIV